MDGYLLISLSEKWLNLFEKKPVFDVYIDEDSKLVLVSQELVKGNC